MCNNLTVPQEYNVNFANIGIDKISDLNLCWLQTNLSTNWQTSASRHLKRFLTLLKWLNRVVFKKPSTTSLNHYCEYLYCIPYGISLITIMYSWNNWKSRVITNKYWEKYIFCYKRDKQLRLQHNGTLSRIIVLFSPSYMYVFFIIYKNLCYF